MKKGCRNIKQFRYEDHIGLWKNELADFMPDRFFDAHEHIGPLSVVGPMDEERARSALTNFTFMEWEDLLQVYARMYAGKEPGYVVGFGFVIHEVDVRAANSYVLHKAKTDPRLLPMLLATPRDPGALMAGYEEACALGVKVYGVKPYYDFADKPGHFTAMDVELEEFVTEDMLQFCQAHKAVLILHTCDIGMGSPRLRAKIQRILDTYTELKLILAHLGRFYVKEEFFDFLDSDFLDKNRNKPFWFDISSVTDPEVFMRTIAREDLRKRLLFAADHPFGLIPGVEMYSETMGGIFLTRDEYPWSDPKLLEQFAEQTRKMTYNNYHCLKSLKDAVLHHIPNDAQRKEFLEDLFYYNACALFGVAP